ncbi:hypothetical protein ASPCAL14948 [Aspergillus calidoustus]|uniref:Uncharacterized protein n=1 Tax=Aspergillus calidoustus TaxID=454130 RepID=A0A0U5GKI4_ASPCI|nr:hypothetical protein ASPCAL14948 [Aspergillus calidoustus]
MQPLWRPRTPPEKTAARPLASKQLFCTQYILDSSWFDWKKEKLYHPIKQVIIRAMGSLNANQRGMIRFYEATEGTLPQQSKQLCGYYLMVYLELLAADPDALLKRHTKQKQGRLVTESGRLMFDGDLGYLARGVSLT